MCVCMCVCVCMDVCVSGVVVRCVCVCVSGVVGYFSTCVSYYDPIVEFSMQECIMFVAILSQLSSF